MNERVQPVELRLLRVASDVHSMTMSRVGPHMGDLSAARQVLEGEVRALENDATLAALQKPLRRPPVL